MSIFLLPVLIFALVICSDDPCVLPTGPSDADRERQFSELAKPPRFDHVPPGFAGTAAMDVGNYTLTVRRGGGLFAGRFGPMAVFFSGHVSYRDASGRGISGSYGSDWASVGFPAEVDDNSAVADRVIRAFPEEAPDASPGLHDGLGLTAETHVFGWSDADYVIVQVALANHTPDPIIGFRGGPTLDIDLGAAGDDTVEFDPVIQGAVISSPVSDTPTLTAVIILDELGPAPGFSAWWNGTDPATWVEFLPLMDAGIGGGVGPRDIRTMLTTGDVDIPAGGSVVLSFALLAGNDRAKLEAAAAAARAQFLILPAPPPPRLVDVDVDIDPDVLNVEARGSGKARITFASEVLAALFDPAQVKLSGVAPFTSDREGADVVIHIKRAELLAQNPTLTVGIEELQVLGELSDGTRYRGSGSVEIRRTVVPLVQLTSGPGDRWPVISPDGKRVVFVRAGAGSHLWVKDLVTGEERQITPPGFWTEYPPYGGPEWAPDNRKIVVGFDFAIWEIDADNPPIDGGSVRKLTPGTLFWDVDPSYSPDGNWILFTREWGAIYRMPAIGELDPGGSPAVRLTTLDFSRGGVWRDGRVLYTSSYPADAHMNIRSVDAFTTDPDAPAPLFVPDEGVDARHPAVRPGSPTGDLYFHSDAFGGEIVRQRDGHHTVLVFAEDVFVHNYFGRQQISVSEDEKLVFTDGNSIWMADVIVLDD
jgi:hypothetical protein